ENEAAMGIDEHGLAFDGVAARVGMDPITKLRPVADVSPLEITWNEQKTVGFLHDGAIDDVDRQAAVELRCCPLIARVASGEHAPERAQARGRMPGELIDQNWHPPREPGQIPVVAALLDEPPGARNVRLFDEALPAQRTARRSPRRVDVAEAGGWEGRPQSHRHQRAGCDRRPHGAAHSAAGPRPSPDAVA